MQLRRPIKRRNAKRVKQRHAKAFGKKAAWIRGLACCVCQRSPVQAHHVKSRGAGGTSEHLVPLCPNCHMAVHQAGAKTFERAMDVDLTHEAQALEAWWQQQDHDSPETWDMGF